MITTLLFCAMASTDLTFATYNIRYGTANDGANRWELRRGIVFDTIREIDADVLGVQEALASQIDEILVIVPGYSFVGVGRNDGKRAGEFSAILYKADVLELVESQTKWMSDTPNVIGSKSWGNSIPRIFTMARFRFQSGEEFDVINTHFDHQSQPSREKSATMIVEFMNSDSASVVMGDLNAGESNAAVMSFLNSGFRDTYRVLFPDEKTVGTFTGFDAKQIEGEKIDHVFCNSGWEVLTAEIVRKRFDRRVPSDHEPVVARLRLK